MVVLAPGAPVTIRIPGKKVHTKNQNKFLSPLRIQIKKEVLTESISAVTVIEFLK